MIIALKITLSKVQKERLFQGKNGPVLDAILYVNDEPDQYGNCGMITQSVTKEERANKVKGAILGNGKIIFGDGKPRAKFSGDPKPISEVVKAAEKMPWE